MQAQDTRVVSSPAQMQTLLWKFSAPSPDRLLLVSGEHSCTQEKHWHHMLVIASTLGLLLLLLVHWVTRKLIGKRASIETNRKGAEPDLLSQKADAELFEDNCFVLVSGTLHSAETSCSAWSSWRQVNA